MSGEVLTGVLLTRAVGGCVLPTEVGGTAVLITCTLVDVPASVVVPTGVVVSPGLVEGVDI
jgi:hypothetical protein